MKNNDLYSKETLEYIFQYIMCIAVCIYKRKHYYLFAYKEYFMLDMKKDLDINLERGILSQEEYNYELNDSSYRGGIYQLTKENFEQFLQLEEVRQLDYAELQKLLLYGFDKQEQTRLYHIVENQLAYDAGISQKGSPSDFGKVNQIASRLPLFYINFDTKVYLHMNWDRLHEDYAYEDWFAKALDFGYLVPDAFCYWKIDGKDFWKFRSI